MRYLKPILLITLLIFASSITVMADVPPLVNLQGYLADDLGPVTGAYEATFRIYDDPVSGTILWSETDSVDVNNGLYSQILGETNPISISFESDRWIGVQFSGHPEMTPRYRQTTVAYSFVAGYSDSSGTVSDNAVTSDKIMDGTVQEVDLAFAPVTRPLTPQVATAEIEDNAITTGKIENGTILPEDLSYTPVSRPISPGITNEELADYAVTSDKIDDRTIAFIDIGQNGTGEGQVMKWRVASNGWVSADDETGGGGTGWNWADSSSHGPDSVHYSDISLQSGNSDSTEAITDGAVDFVDIGQNSAVDGQIIKWNAASSAWILAIDETGSGGTSWNWADSSSYGPDSVHFADVSVQSTFSDSTSAITDGAIDFADIGRNGTIHGQVMKWNGISAAWEPAIDETGGGGTANGWIDDGTYVRLEQTLDSVGIGTATPSEKLDVNGNIRVAGKATIGGGHINIGQETFVAGGFNNTVSGDRSVALGGTNNTASGERAFMGGGVSSIASGRGSVALGGQVNIASGDESTVSGGLINTASGNSSTVGGGYSNSAIGRGTTISGGEINTADSNWASIGGGWRNYANGPYATIGGGASDTVRAQWGGIASGYNNKVGLDGANHNASFIGGGSTNSVFSTYGVIGGGAVNIVEGTSSSILGGFRNSIGLGSSYSAILGGGWNAISSDALFSSILGGYADTVSGTLSFLIGIRSNLSQDSTFMVDMPHIRFGNESTGYEFPTLDGETAQVLSTDGSGQLSWVDMSGGGGSGGWVDDGISIRLETDTDNVGIGTATPTEKLDVDGNMIVSGKATIGLLHTNTGQSAFIAGGMSNTASGQFAVALGGISNVVSGNNSSVTGGTSNTASGGSSTIGGGTTNTVSGGASVIGGGQQNKADSGWATIGGGIGNYASNMYATIGGGYRDTVLAEAGGVFAGLQNSIGTAGQYSFVGGGAINKINASSATIGGGERNEIYGFGSAILGGQTNIVDQMAYYSSIGGGAFNYIGQQSHYSSIPGGYADSIASYTTYSYLFGINANLSQDSTFMVDMPHIRFGNQSTGYEFPDLDGVTGQVLSTDGSGQLSWVDMSGGGGGGGWVDDGTSIRLETVTDFVGIGTANPSVELDVRGDMKASRGNLGFNNTNTGSSAFVAGYENEASGTNSSVSGGFQNTANATRSNIGGGSQNNVSGGYSAILGGSFNSASAEYSMVGAGRYDTTHALGGGVASGLYNTAGDTSADTAAFIGGGSYNSVTGRYGFIGGGKTNIVNGNYGTIGGGLENIVGIDGNGTVAGGSSNEALGASSMVPGGVLNFAYGMASFAAGRQAKALHNGSFVWSDFGANDFSSTAANQVRFQASGGFDVADQLGNSIIKLDPTARRITINNTSGNPIVEIGEGLDYAEIFSTTTENLEPGTVMIIDPENPGHLTVSRNEYDKKVSGIIAGANGMGTGVKLGRKTEIGDEAIALAGRVYCNVDASYGSIEPGDLLTTSPTPGYAMVVKDYSRAPGSILGKAMEPLEEGEKGKILVLVTLQ